MVKRIHCRQVLTALAVGLATMFLYAGAVPNAFARDRVSDTAASPARLKAETLADLPALLAQQFPSVRSLLVAHGDCIVAEYYSPGTDASSHSPIRSVTKSMLSILVGIALDRGYLRLDQKISELLPEAMDPAVDPHARDITVRDLLTMTSGFDRAPFGTKPAVVPAKIWQWLLYRRVQHPPGTQFSYDDDAVNLLSVVLTHVLKQSATAFSEQNLFRPLGIVGVRWPADSDGILAGADALSLSARDMAKIGLLWLQGGRWGGRQIVSPGYVADSTAEHNTGGPPTHAAYGYLWWVKPTKTGLRAFFASGKGSQLIYVVPERDLVVAMASDSSVTGGSVRFVNDVVLPAAGRLPDPPSCIDRLAASHAAH